jgi:hypothetical protein
MQGPGATAASQMSDDDLRRVAGQVDPATDAVMSIPTGLGQGVAGVLGIAGDAENGLHNFSNHYAPGLINSVLGTKLPVDPVTDVAARDHIPSSRDVNGAIQWAAGDYYQPQTWAGRLTDTLGSMAPAALLPGSALARAARVIVPSATSDAAGETARAISPQNEQAARFWGGLAGGIGEGVGEGYANAPYSLAGKFTGNPSDQELASALALMDKAKNLPGGGLQLTFPEAMSAQGIGTLNRVQHYVENSVGGGAATRPFFAARPGQVANVTSAVADQFAPASSTPSMLGVDAQRAATGAQFDLNQARKAASGPAYTAAGPEGVDGKGLADILDNINSQIAGDKTGLLGARLQQFKNDLTDKEGLAHVDVDNLSRVRNHWNDLIDIGPVGNDPLSKEQAGAIGGHLANIDALLGNNANFAKGTAAYADASRNLVDPVNAGPLGRVAATSSVPEQTAALFRPENVGGSAETADALQRLGARDPSLPAGLVSQYLRNSASATNGALRQLGNGANEWGGSALATRLASAPEQRAALLGGAQVANPSAAPTLADVIDAFAATGQRMAPGSRTAFNEEMKDAMGMQRFSPISPTDPLEWGRLPLKWLNQNATSRKMQVLGDMVTEQDPQALSDFIARTRQSRLPNAALANALMSYSAGDGRQQLEPPP